MEEANYSSCLLCPARPHALPRQRTDGRTARSKSLGDAMRRMKKRRRCLSGRNNDRNRPTDPRCNVFCTCIKDGRTARYIEVVVLLCPMDDTLRRPIKKILALITGTTEKEISQRKADRRGWLTDHDILNVRSSIAGGIVTWQHSAKHPSYGAASSCRGIMMSLIYLPCMAAAREIYDPCLTTTSVVSTLNFERSIY